MSPLGFCLIILTGEGQPQKEEKWADENSLRWVN